MQKWRKEKSKKKRGKYKADIRKEEKDKKNEQELIERKKKKTIF